MGEAVILGSVAAVVSGLMVREAWCFFCWKRSLGRMDRTEWTRVVRALREADPQRPAYMYSGTSIPSTSSVLSSWVRK